MIYHLLNTIAPVFLLVLVGFVAVRRALFEATTIDALMRYAIRFAIPCLLFRAVSQLDLGAAYDWRAMASFYLAALTCFGVAGSLARHRFGRRPGEAVAVGFVGLFSNTVLLGLPVIELGLGAEALPTAYALISVHAPFCYLLGIVTMELVRADGRPLGETATVVAREMFQNSLMIGIGLGFVANLSGLPSPTFFTVALDMVAESALPLALVGLGGVLARYSLSERIVETVMTVSVSLILHPAIALVLCLLLGVARPERDVVVLLAAMAPGINAYLFAALYGRAEGTSAAGVLLGTAAAALTVAIWSSILAAI